MCKTMFHPAAGWSGLLWITLGLSGLSSGSLFALQPGDTADAASADSESSVSAVVPENDRQWRVEPLRHRDPVLETTRRRSVFAPRLQELWLQALQRDEADLQRQAAEAIVRAHQQGMPNLINTSETLAQLVRQPAVHPAVRLAVAQTLIALDDQRSVPALAEPLDRAGLDYAQIVEPALARWDHPPMREVWRARLREPNGSVALRLLAIRCLGIVRDATATEALQQIVRAGNQPAGFRLAAARALAEMPSDASVSLAQSLAAREGTTRLADQLCAATLLAATDASASIPLLLQLAVNQEPTVAAVALQRLLQVAPEQVVPLADSLLANRDSNVRLLVVRCLATQPAAAQIPRLANLLGDRHPDVRGTARQVLTEMAAVDALKPLVQQAAEQSLTVEDWRELEQAGLLVAALDHQPAAARLVTLLEHPRREVLMTSAWALRVLAVTDALPAMREYAERQANLLRNPPAGDEGASNRLMLVPAQLGHLFEAFGIQHYAESESLLREFVPKNHGMGDTARAAAVWSLGWLHLDQESEELAEQLAERLADLNLLDAEADEVRICSAIALGRMKASSAMPTLRKFRAEGNGTVIGRATGWAIHRIMGTSLEDPGERDFQQQGWFLEPISD